MVININTTIIYLKSLHVAATFLLKLLQLSKMYLFCVQYGYVNLIIFHQIKKFLAFIIAWLQVHVLGI